LNENFFQYLVSWRGKVLTFGIGSARGSESFANSSQRCGNLFARFTNFDIKLCSGFALGRFDVYTLDHQFCSVLAHCEQVASFALRASWCRCSARQGANHASGCGRWIARRRACCGNSARALWPITPRPYGIRPRNIRMADVVARGCAQEDFSEAFRRYIPPSEIEDAQGKGVDGKEEG
jgi:hypothetical protein